MNNFALASKGTGGLALLKECWDRAGKKEPEQKGLISSAVIHRVMRADYILLPTLPTEAGIGFVVLLRDIRTIHHSELFVTRFDMRIRDGQRGMYRIGRFNDSIRYAIAQRMAFLFTRIGMTEHFETECKSAADLIVESFTSLSK